MKPVAVIVIANDITIEVLKIKYSTDDYVMFRWNIAGKLSKPVKSKIRYGENGNPFFMSGGKSHDLNEAVRLT